MRPPLEFGAEIKQEADTEVTVPPAVMICTRLAGRAIIRVVSRCNDAQENCNLGKVEFSQCIFFYYKCKKKIKIKKRSALI